MKSKLILLVISLIAVLIFAEIAFRLSGKYQTYTERTGTGGYVSPFEVGFDTWYRVHPANKKIEYHNEEFSASWFANNEGLNDKPFSTSQKCSIMVLGDSFTEGSGASNDSSYPRQLADLVRDSLAPSGEVWNCGVGGSDLIFEFTLFRDRLLKYKPSLVIVTVNNTDIPEVMIRGGFERFGQDGKTHYRKGPWFEPLFAHSFLVRRVVFDVLHYNWQFIKTSQEQNVRDSAIAQLCSAMDSFAILCSARNIDLLFAFHPMKNEMEGDKYFAIPLIAYCGRHGYNFVDLREQFHAMGIDSTNASSLYWNIDGHFNNKGYNYLAKGIFDHLSGFKLH